MRLLLAIGLSATGMTFMPATGSRPGPPPPPSHSNCYLIDTQGGTRSEEAIASTAAQVGTDATTLLAENGGSSVEVTLTTC